MKTLSLLLCLIFLSGCMLLRQPPQDASRRLPPAVSDLDNLEMLLMNEQNGGYSEQAQLETERLRIGMPKSYVRRQLGHPSVVEVAGNPVYGNERWIYENSIETLKGSYQETRVIYFEEGSVVGWETK